MIIDYEKRHVCSSLSQSRGHPRIGECGYDPCVAEHISSEQEQIADSLSAGLPLALKAPAAVQLEIEQSRTDPGSCRSGTCCPGRSPRRPGCTLSCTGCS